MLTVKMTYYIGKFLAALLLSSSILPSSALSPANCAINDCDVVKVIWRKLGKTEPLPDKCSGKFGIVCSKDEDVIEL
jgi:hypothetical protein